MPRKAYRNAIAVNIIILLIFATAAFSIVKVVERYALDDALEEARAKARIIMARNLSTHAYFAKQLKPSVFSLPGGKRPEGYFDPRWMSSTFAVREIDRMFKENDDFSNYYYKEAAINARTPENEADGMEREFLKRLNEDESLQMDAGVRTIDGTPYFVVMHRGETMEQSCMMCHSTPGAAPSGLVEHYGAVRSFNREVGQVVSAMSIRIPLAEAFKRAEARSARMKTALLIIFGVVLASQIYITSRIKVANEVLKGEINERAAAEGMLRQALKDKDMLIREVHHRVKNHLAVLQSLLSMQSRRISDDRAKTYLIESESRLKTLSMIHEQLYRAEDLKNVMASEYIRGLATQIFRAFSDSSGSVRLEVDVEKLSLDIDTLVPVALIINEAMTNSLKYAFPEGRKGSISVRLKKQDGGFVLNIEDDGVGMPGDIDMEKAETMGLMVINILAKQINGDLRVRTDKGTAYEIAFRDMRIS